MRVGQLELIRPERQIVTLARRVPDTEAGVRHFTLTFENLDATFEKIIVAGVHVVERPRDAYNRDMLARVAFVLDPDGIVIELAQRFFSAHSAPKVIRQVFPAKCVSCEGADEHHLCGSET